MNPDLKYGIVLKHNQFSPKALRLQQSIRVFLIAILEPDKTHVDHIYCFDRELDYEIYTHLLKKLARFVVNPNPADEKIQSYNVVRFRKQCICSEDIELVLNQKWPNFRFEELDNIIEVDHD